MRILGILAMLAPGAAIADLITIEGFYGIERPPSTDLSGALSGTTASPSLFDTSLQMAGGDVLVRLGFLEFGAIADSTWGTHTASQTAIGGLGGIALGTGSLRIDLLAEVGGHRFGNLTSNPEIVTASSSEEWLLYVGLRPGISFKLGNGPLSLGLWVFARWDVTSKDVPVTVGSAGSEGSYTLGGTTIGATARLGLEF
jgi:hypothetical protein